MSYFEANESQLLLPALSELGEFEREIVWLVDNGKAYGAIAAAIAGAQHTIAISQLALDADFVGSAAADSESEPVVPFIQLLMDAVRERDVSVRILLNTTLLLDTLNPLRRFLAGQLFQDERLQLRGLGFFPQLLHAKIVIVDSEVAFLVGSPFVNGYWDSGAHSPVDSTRPVRELAGRPLHDVSVQISGTPVGAVEKFYEQLWAAGVGDDDAAAPKPASRDRVWSSTAPAVRIDTTVPEGIASFGSGSTAILRTLKGALRRATSLIYLEQQYLSSQRIFTELRRALERNPGLEIIIVSNQNPDVTAYARWQVAGLREFGMLDHPRVGLFALWSGSQVGSRRELNQVFVHSKVVIADDKWVMCGSANLDGVSLHSYGADFAGMLGRRVFRNVRNFDVAASVDGFDDSGDLEIAQSLRHDLWSEHLGHHYNPAHPVPAEGWVVRWREIAAQNTELLNSGVISKKGAFILPYSVSGKPGAQLTDCGVDWKNDSLHLQFNPGWVERRFELGWVRNMFL